MSTDADVLYALLREDFNAFVRKAFEILHGNVEFSDAPYLKAIAYQLAKIAHGDCSRLLINVPPRHLKSIMTSVVLPAFTLGHYPNTQITCISYSEELAIDLSKKTRALMQSECYQAVFPNAVLTGSTQDRLTLAAGGYRRAVTMAGAITGFGGDLLIVDDPQKTDDVSSEVRRAQTIETFFNTIATRLNDPMTGRIVVVQQRLHENDLSGALVEKGNWTHLSLPAIAEVDETLPLGKNKYWKRIPGDVLDPKRLPMTQLEQIRKEIGPLSFATQYQQQPSVKGGFLAEWGWFRRYESITALGAPEQIIQSWDAATTPGPHGNYSVCTTWYLIDHCLHLVNVLRIKKTLLELMKIALFWAEKWHTNLWLVEATGIGIPLCDFLIANRGSRTLVPHHPRESKEERLMAHAHYIEQGRVWIPQQAKWLLDFKSEWCNFPNGKYDDQVDSVTQTLKWMNKWTAKPPLGWEPPSEALDDAA